MQSMKTAKFLTQSRSDGQRCFAAAVFFYPISKLLFGNDRLFIVCYPVEKFRREAHILEHWCHTLVPPHFRERSRLFAKNDHGTGNLHVFSS